MSGWLGKDVLEGLVARSQRRSDGLRRITARLDAEQVESRPVANFLELAMAWQGQLLEQDLEYERQDSILAHGPTALPYSNSRHWSQIVADNVARDSAPHNDGPPVWCDVDGRLITDGPAPPLMKELAAV